MMNERVQQITARIAERSADSRSAYLTRMRSKRLTKPARNRMGCANLAHVMAAEEAVQKKTLAQGERANIAILTAYNDMLSAHQPLASYPPKIKAIASQMGCTAQVAGGVPAMCDGITQGTEGMELSLLSRDVVALSASIGLSHAVFDAALALGVCDKIVPGLVIAALHFGHLPFIFVPAGPMPSGATNDQKATTRRLHAEGSVSRLQLLEVESACYHSPGTCTFYGTANTNQMLMEFMGLHLPGASFVSPESELREAFTEQAVRRVVQLTGARDTYTPIGEVLTVEAFVNAIVGLLATGGSTNHTIHLIAMAMAAGIQLRWDDFSDLSKVVPLVVRVYPNGSADINDFQAAGGVPRVIETLLEGGFLQPEVMTVAGRGLARYAKSPRLSHNEGGREITWHPLDSSGGDSSIIRTFRDPFSLEGGLRVVDGNLGRGVVKTSALKDFGAVVRAPALVFENQVDVIHAFEDNQLNRDFVAVVRFQGPKANGMPELHKLIPILSSVMKRGYQVALVTDGRLSGASGKVPAAIHLCPEAAAGGPIAKIRDGDWITLDANRGELRVELSDDDWSVREEAANLGQGEVTGFGRELFTSLRHQLSSAEQGASIFHPSKESL